MFNCRSFKLVDELLMPNLIFEGFKSDSFPSEGKVD